MAEGGSTRKRKARQEEPQKKPALSCCLKSCSGTIGRDDEKVEVVFSGRAARHLIDTSSDGEGVFHRGCWEEVLRNSRARNPRRVTMKMSAKDKSLISEAAKTAEYHDKADAVKEKGEKIAALIKASKHCVVFTGAGVSTSAGIGDYRGKSGQWTKMDRQNRPAGDSSDSASEGDSQASEGVPYDRLRPTYTHEAIAKLTEAGLVKHVISQNVDGLHELSGVPPARLSELHGNVFLEACWGCGREYRRSFYVPDDLCSQYYEELEDNGTTDIKRPPHAKKCDQCGLSHSTGRSCDHCSTQLMDTIINFGDDLSEESLSTARKEATFSDLFISLGTTMLVTPASDLVLLGQEPLCLVIVNRQRTQFDYLCEGKGGGGGGVRVFGDCDGLMRSVMENLFEEKERVKWEKERAKRLKFYDSKRD